MILNEAFLKTKIGTAGYKYSVLENKKFEANKKYDLFISHSYMDKELVEVLYKMFEESGYEVYIDWKEEKLQNRENVSADTARILKNRINSCLGLSFIATGNIVNSKWCPWELGYADGKKNRAAILPITKEEVYEYNGLEYLGIYPYITYSKIQNSNIYEFWVHDVKDKNKYTTLKKWLETGELQEH